MTPEAQTTILTFTFCTLAVIGMYVLITAPLLFIWHKLHGKPVPQPAPQPQICTRSHFCGKNVEQGPCNGYPRPRWELIDLRRKRGI
jgi:hypothetical protein